MSTNAKSVVDWPGWLRRWDVQQVGYVPEREARFSAMFDALAGLLPETFVALDLACGPGSISQRLLARFPGAQAIAVDIDPVMLAVGRAVLGTVDSRLSWIEADLAAPNWQRALGEQKVDAVLSTTALHWLEPAALARVYGDIYRLLRPGGLFLNGDHMSFGPALPTLARLSDSDLNAQWTDTSFAARGIETAEQWWAAIAREPGLESLLAARTQILAKKKQPDSRLGFDAHVRALREAGFREIGTIWQVLSDRVLVAVRGPGD